LPLVWGLFVLVPLLEWGFIYLSIQAPQKKGEEARRQLHGKGGAQGGGGVGGIWKNIDEFKKTKAAAQSQDSNDK